MQSHSIDLRAQLPLYDEALRQVVCKGEGERRTLRFRNVTTSPNRWSAARTARVSMTDRGVG
jgi:hypothetical protein